MSVPPVCPTGSNGKAAAIASLTSVRVMDERAMPASGLPTGDAVGVTADVD